MLSLRYTAHLWRELRHIGHGNRLEELRSTREVPDKHRSLRACDLPKRRQRRTERLAGDRGANGNDIS